MIDDRFLDLHECILDVTTVTAVLCDATLVAGVKPKPPAEVATRGFEALLEFGFFGQRGVVGLAAVRMAIQLSGEVAPKAEAVGCDCSDYPTRLFVSRNPHRRLIALNYNLPCLKLRRKGNLQSKAWRLPMRPVCSLRDKLVLIVMAACAICLAPAAFAWNTPRFDPIQCPTNLPTQLANARCGYLVVPEDRSQRSGRTIQLFVAIIPAQSGKPAPDPVVYLGSGPGGIAIYEVAHWSMPGSIATETSS